MQPFKLLENKKKETQTLRAGGRSHTDLCWHSSYCQQQVDLIQFFHFLFLYTEKLGIVD